MNGYRVGRKADRMKTQPVSILRADTAGQNIGDFARQESITPNKEASMNNNEGCRPALMYVRSANDEGDGLAAQVERCREYAKRKDFSISEECIYRDRAVPGNTLNRPGLNALISDVRTGKASSSQLIVLDRDRLSRNSGDLIKVVETLHKMGVAVHFVDGLWDRTNSDRILSDVIDSLKKGASKLELIKQANRTKRLEARSFRKKK